MPKTTLRSIAAILVGLTVLSGCKATSLYSARVERVCTEKRCYLRSDAETVSKRCSRGQKLWDDGTAYDPGDTSRWARCCVVLAKDGRRYQLWITEGHEECLAHEECHIETWEADDKKYFHEHHKRCHNFGLGREKKQL